MKNLLYLVIVLVPIIGFGQSIELVIPTGHTSQIKKITVNRDTSYIASIQNTSDIILWNRKFNEIDRVLGYHQARVNDAFFYENLLISGGDDKKIIVWDFEQKKVIHSLKHSEKLRSVCQTSTHLLGVGKKGIIKRWDKSFKEVDSIKLNLNIVLTSLNKSGSQLLVASRDSLILMNTQSLKPIESFGYHDGELTAIYMRDSICYIGNTKGELVAFSSNQSEINRIKAFDFRLYNIAELNESTLLVSGRDANTNIKSIDKNSFGISELNINLGEKSKLSEGGIQAFTIDKGVIYIPDYDYGISSFDTNWELIKNYEGLSYPLNDITFSYNEKLLAVASSEEQIRIYDLSGVKPVVTLAGHTGGVSSLTFHPTDTLIASVGFDNNLKIWSLSTGDNLYTYSIKGELISTPIQFDISGQYIIQKTSEDFFELYSLEKSKSKKIKIKNGFKYKFFENGEKILFGTKGGLYIYNAISLSQESFFNMEKIADMDVKGETIVALFKDKLIVYSLDFKEIKSIPLPEEYDKVYLNPNQKTAIASVNSAKKGSSYRDYKLKSIDLENGDVTQLIGHVAFTSNILFPKDGKFTLSSAKDGQIIIWEDNEKKGSFIPLKGNEWITVTPEGVYDASQLAFNKMHYVRGNEQFGMDQLKDLYYEPKLLPRLLDFIADPIQQRKPLDEIAPYPEIDIKHPQVNNGVLGLNIHDNGGGVGWVVIKINGKEVLREIKNESNEDFKMDYPIDGHPFLKPSTLNKISVKAYSGDGSVTSPEKKFYFYGDHRVGHEITKPKLYGLIIGTDDYPGESMDLNYAGKDANDFASALGLASNNYYGEENTNIKILNTRNKEKATWPSKENIISSLKELAEKATAQDVLVIYMSGHGTNYGDDGAKEFYYLTADATDNLSNDEIRKNTTLSSRELTNWIKEIPALQQVLILDACHSGKLTTEIEELATINTSQIKSLEKMKDRTGLYILAGSESDAVSFESSIYEQGLLTYSILFGMKGATRDQKGQINVIDLFQFVTKKVPELASEIGQIQMPEIKIPSQSEEFSLGSIRIEDQNKIDIVDSKPVFIQSGFQEQNKFNDPILLGARIDRQLMKISNEKERPLVFLDKKFYSSAYLIKGRYEQLDNQVRAKVRLFQDDQKIKDFTVNAVNSKILAEKIVELALKSI